MTGYRTSRLADVTQPSGELEPGRNAEVFALTHQLFDHLRQYATGAVGEYEDHQFEVFAEELEYEARVWCRAALSAQSLGPDATASVEHEQAVTVQRVAAWVWQSSHTAGLRPE